MISAFPTKCPILFHLKRRGEERRGEVRRGEGIGHGGRGGEEGNDMYREQKKSQ